MSKMTNFKYIPGRKYLRHKKTGMIFGWTKEQAAKDTMEIVVPGKGDTFITEEEARKLSPEPGAGRILTEENIDDKIAKLEALKEDLKAGNDDEYIKPDDVTVADPDTKVLASKDVNSKKEAEEAVGGDVTEEEKNAEILKAEQRKKNAEMMKEFHMMTAASLKIYVDEKKDEILTWPDEVKEALYNKWVRVCKTEEIMKTVPDPENPDETIEVTTGQVYNPFPYNLGL